MKNFRRILIPVLLSVLIVDLVKAQGDDTGEKEESNIPKKVLRKYRIRRPVIVDQNGNAVTTPSVPRLRRIRVNTPNKPQSIPQSPLQPSKNSIAAINSYSYAAQEPQPQPLIQQFNFEGQPHQVIEPVRVVPMYRKATPSSTRSALLANVNLKDRGPADEEHKKQHIGTTRNYSRINDDGSFTFGYEGEDGSFKEETRGTDCVVRGKYGYVDPDGVTREFAYVSGNPCDPNNPDKDDTPEEQEEPALPQRTIISRPRRPVITQDVQQNLDQSATEEAIPTAFRSAPRNRFQPEIRSHFQQPTTFRPYQPRVRHREQLVSTPAPQPTFQPFQLQGRSVQSAFRQPQPTRPPFPTAGPILSLDERGANRAFDFEQEIQRIQQHQPQGHQQAGEFQPFVQQQQLHTQLPQFQNTQTLPTPTPTTRFGPGSVHRFPHRQYFGGANAAAILQQPQQTTPTTPHFQNLAFQQQPRPVLPQPIVPTNSIQEEQQPVTGFGNYRTELVFDPSTGRYSSVYAQGQPKEEDQFSLTQQFRGFVDPNRPQQFHVQMFRQPQLQYFPQHQQSANQQFQRALFQNQYQPLGSTRLTSLHADAQEAINSPASGQIDAFLSNLNLSS